MFGDAKTISDEDNGRGSPSLDAPGEWTTPSSPAGLGPSITPSWDTAWAAETAAPVEPNGWPTAEHLPDLPPATEPPAFVGWGGLANPDPAAVSPDLSGWDSPSDAVLAVVADASWGFRPTAEAPLWTVEPDREASESAWAELPDPPSSSAAAWDRTPCPPVEAEQNAPDVAFPAPATAFAEANPAPLVDPIGEFQSTIPVVLTSDNETASAGVPTRKRRGHLATRSAARSAAPVATELESVTPIDATHDALPDQLATADFPQPTSVENELQAEDTAPGHTSPASDTAFMAPIEPLNDAAPADDPSPSDTAFVAPIEPLNVEQAVAATPSDTASATPIEGLNVEQAVTATPSRKAGRSFFAKRAPGDATMSSRETPKVLRIGAVVSLLVGIGLFGTTVITSRSSDTRPTVVTTPAAPVSTPATAPVVETTDDPILGSSDTVGSPNDFAGATVAPDPIFGSDETVSSQTVTTGATVVIDPVFGSGGSPSTVDPLFGSSPAEAANAGEVTASANDGLSFERPAAVSR